MPRGLTARSCADRLSLCYPPWALALHARTQSTRTEADTIAYAHSHTQKLTRLKTTHAEGHAQGRGQAGSQRRAGTQLLRDPCSMYLAGGLSHRATHSRH